MDVSDMLDVIHYFYEDDLNFSTIEQAKMLDTRRKHVYREMYNTEYVYASPDEPSQNDLVPFDSSGEGIKPYIPPTDFNPDSVNPFGAVLDAPIGS